MSRINAYRALSSPSLIALSSTDPILSAFELSAELKRLAYVETEFRQEYMVHGIRAAHSATSTSLFEIKELRRQCQQFACDLLSHTRSSTELAVLLNHDPSSNPSLESSQQNLNLTRLELAIDYKQKKVITLSEDSTSPKFHARAGMMLISCITVCRSPKHPTASGVHLVRRVARFPSQISFTKDDRDCLDRIRLSGVLPALFGSPVDGLCPADAQALHEVSHSRFLIPLLPLCVENMNE